MSKNAGAAPMVPLDMLAESWGVVIANAVPLMGGFVCVAVINLAANWFFTKLHLRGGGLLLQGPLLYGFYLVALKAVRGQKPELPEVFAGFQHFVPAFLAGLLTTIIQGLGMALCLVPGLVAVVLYLPVYLYMIDEKLDFWPAMEKSRLTIWNNFMPWAILTLVLFGLIVAGIATCGIGLIVTGPMCAVMVVKAYEVQRAQDISYTADSASS